MKMYLGDVPVKALYMHTDTDDANLVPSDMHSGKTAYVKGRKITGTGRAFAYAMYGSCSSNASMPIPVSSLNAIGISCASYAVKMTDGIIDLGKNNYTTARAVANVTIDGTNYPITVKIASGTLTIACSKTVTLQVLFGKDDHQ